jgi:hypothetical protein
MPKTQVPTAQGVAALFTELFERDVIVKLLPKPPATDHGVVANYALDDGQRVVTAALDVPLAASLGASLSRFGPNVVDAAVQKKQIEPAVFDNLREVLNICASLFNAAGTPHVVFKDAVASATAAAEAAKSLGAKTALHFAVTVPGYKAGNLSFFVG